MQIGNMYLVPNTLGSDNRVTQLPHVIPVENLRQIAKLKYWIVEDAKTSRAFLNAVHEIESLHHSLQDMVMQEWRGPDRKHPLSQKPQDLLAPLRAGHDVGLLSEAGVPGVGSQSHTISRPQLDLARTNGKRSQWSILSIQRLSSCRHSAALKKVKRARGDLETSW